MKKIIVLIFFSLIICISQVKAAPTPTPAPLPMFYIMVVDNEYSLVLPEKVSAEKTKVKEKGKVVTSAIPYLTFTVTPTIEPTKTPKAKEIKIQ